MNPVTPSSTGAETTSTALTSSPTGGVVHIPVSPADRIRNDERTRRHGECFDIWYAKQAQDLSKKHPEESVLRRQDEPRRKKVRARILLYVLESVRVTSTIAIRIWNRNNSVAVENQSGSGDWSW